MLQNNHFDLSNISTGFNKDNFNDENSNEEKGMEMILDPDNFSISSSININNYIEKFNKLKRKLEINNKAFSQLNKELILLKNMTNSQVESQKNNNQLCQSYENLKEEYEEITKKLGKINEFMKKDI